MWSLLRRSYREGGEKEGKGETQRQRKRGKEGGRREVEALASVGIERLEVHRTCLLKGRWHQCTVRELLAMGCQVPKGQDQSVLDTNTKSFESS